MLVQLARQRSSSACTAQSFTAHVTSQSSYNPSLVLTRKTWYFKDNHSAFAPLNAGSTGTEQQDGKRKNQMPPNVLISTHFISKFYGAQPLFTDISLQVFDNERLGLIGPNGAGKSTFLKILADMEPADSGEISRKRNIRMVYLPQEDVLDPEKTVEETLFHAIPKELEAWQVSKRRQEIIRLIQVDKPGGKNTLRRVAQKGGHRSSPVSKTGFTPHG